MDFFWPESISPDAIYHEDLKANYIRFAQAFDDWSILAAKEYRRACPEDLLRPVPSGPPPLGPPTEVEELAWAFALICRQFILGDLWAGAFCLHRQGASLDRIEYLSHYRYHQCELDTNARKWRAGLAIMGLSSNGFHRCVFRPS